MNTANPYMPIVSPSGLAPPLVVRLIVQPKPMETMGGVVSSATRNEDYVCLSALPDELRQRVIVAVQAMQAGM
jgi:hypothetical protein